MPVVGLVNGRSAEDAARNAAAFRMGLRETGYVESQNVTVEYHWMEGQYPPVRSVWLSAMPSVVWRSGRLLVTPVIVAPTLRR